MKFQLTFSFLNKWLIFINTELISYKRDNFERSKFIKVELTFQEI